VVKQIKVKSKGENMKLAKIMTAAVLSGGLIMGLAMPVVAVSSAGQIEAGQIMKINHRDSSDYQDKIDAAIDEVLQVRVRVCNIGSGSSEINNAALTNVKVKASINGLTTSASVSADNMINQAPVVSSVAVNTTQAAHLEYVAGSTTEYKHVGAVSANNWSKVGNLNDAVSAEGATLLENVEVECGNAHLVGYKVKVVADEPTPPTPVTPVKPSTPVEPAAPKEVANTGAGLVVGTVLGAGALAFGATKLSRKSLRK
jgi:hypothetical protein